MQIKDFIDISTKAGCKIGSKTDFITPYSCVEKKFVYAEKLAKVIKQNNKE